MAAKKWEQLLESYQSNAYPAMIRDLAEHLGVTEDSVRRLAPGWAPIVTFKKGPNFQGWWAIPERDSAGTVIGLSLRSQNSRTKCMMPGAKHGLVYEVNPDHQLGSKGYDAGPQNWVRTMDAGILCPICGKPDGCIISAENPADPKAVICIRIKEGSVRPMRFGHLHIRKATGDLKGRSALADNGGIVLVVEGFSDTAAGMDLGFNAVGRPSNLAGMDVLANLLRGRSAVVLGENDRKSDGTHPGREGMVAAFQVLSRTCKDVRMLMPPEHVKDLRQWKNEFGLTREQFDTYLEEAGERHAEISLIDDDRPLTFARAYLDANYRMAGRYTIRRWRNTWYRYKDSRYQPISDEMFQQPIRSWFHDKHVQVTTPSGGTVVQKVKATNAFVDNLLDAIKGEVLIDDDTTVPCWINGHDGPDATDMVVFANGILHLPSYFTGTDSALIDPTPDLFTTAALPFSYDPLAACPRWKIFVGSTLGDEAAKVMLLREWIGYCMTPDKTHQKMMYMRGPTAAGKSVILNTLCQLVGKGQYAATDFSSLSGSFGLNPLMGKLVCVVGDARVDPDSGRTDVLRGLEVLLNITGNDEVQVNRKYKDQIDAAQITARITMSSNMILPLPDHAGALLRRLLLLEFKRSFAGREDTTLQAKLNDEIPGIALWALEGLRRLRSSMTFTKPKSSEEAAAEWRLATNPLAAFIEECCDVEEGKEVGKMELYDAWNGWSMERRMRPTTRSTFFDRMRTAVPTVTSETYMQGVHKMSVYRGITLKPWAEKKFTGRP